MYNYLNSQSDMTTIIGLNITDFASNVLENLGFGVVIISAETDQIVYVNQKIISMSGYPANTIIGQKSNKLLCPDEVGQDPILDIGHIMANSDGKILCANGSTLQIIKSVVPSTFNDRGYLIVSLVDNTEQKNIEETTRDIAYHDNLTGLQNRLFFYEQIDHVIALANRSEQMLALFYLDLDGFKMINDSMGHIIGDELLIEVSKRIVNTMRKSDTTVRMGGDEFIIMIENLKNLDSIVIIAEKILQCFKKPFCVNNMDLYISASIGTAVYPVDGTDGVSLIKKADIAMYDAKAKGKNQYSISNIEMQSRSEENMALGRQLYRAIECNELELYYQPQIDVKSSHIIGMEALLRWNHPELGIVYPVKFLQIAENTGLIVKIGEWVIRTACRQNKVWQEAGLSKIKISINLSAKQLLHPNLVSLVKDILRDTEMDPKYLELEIIESVAIKEKEFIIESLHKLKEIGITIVIDNFGSEFFSLNHFENLPIDKLKIARQFVQGIGVSDNDETLTKTIISLARNMGLNVVAQGVEQKNQLDFIGGCFCDEVQGFYYFKPMTVTEVEKLITRANIE